MTRDPELRYSASGIAVIQFTLALDRPVGKDRPKETDFIPVVVWRQLAEACANYLRKGKLCACEGRLQTRNYENKDGVKIYVTEVIADNVRFLESASKDNAGSGNSNSNSSRDNQDPFSGDGRPVDISDDDLPFSLWMKFRMGWTQKYYRNGDAIAHSWEVLDGRNCA